jgi:hypothetical protein
VEISILPHIGQAPEFEALIRSLTLKASDG